MLGILKMGTTDPEIRKQFGDFENWILEALPAERRTGVSICDPAKGSLPDPASLGAVVITGSPSMVTHPSPGELVAFRWLERAMKAEVSVLGLCYGHQMIGHVLGGEIGPLPGGPEIGVVEVEFVAKDDPLFAPCGNRQEVAVLHWQSILRLPAGAQALGRSAREPHHAVRFAPRVWGVQFHPEFSPAVLTELTRRDADALSGQGESPKLTVSVASRWREQTDLIARFARLALA